MRINGLLQVLALILGCVTVQAQVVTEAWVRRYSYEEIASSDRGRAAVIDGSGNLIVAGTTDDGSPASDWLIIKYTGAGMPIWTNRFNGAGDKTDTPNAVAVGTNGTVFVTGNSSPLSYSDCTTIAYSAAGVPLWTNHYDGPIHYSDSGSAVAVGANGTVFITGRSHVSTTSAYTVADNYLTIAYTETGVPLWTNLFNGPANSTDTATALAVSPNGGVFVTGYSYSSRDFCDYATIAYSGAGVPLWTNRYSGPSGDSDFATAVALSTDGVVYVTGRSASASVSGDDDYATIAYSDAGVPLWTNRYDGPANGSDQANAVAVSPNGDVLVTGYSYKGTNFYDYATVAYSGAGVPLWTNRYDGVPNTPNVVNALAVNTDETVFVTGSSVDGNNRYDYATIAYSGAGVPLWTNRYDGPGNTNDQANALAVSPDGTVFVTGNSGNGNSYDCATIAYSGAGVSLWTNRFDGVANKTDQVTAVVVGPDGTAFVTGTSFGVSNRYDQVTIAYSGAGLPLWTNRYYGMLYDYEKAPALAVGFDGTLFVAGLHSPSGFGTLAISSAGVPLWTNYNTSGIGHVSGVAVNSNGTVFVTGYYSIKPGNVYRTIAISSAGVSLWNLAAGNTYVGVHSGSNVLLTGWGWTRAYSEAGVPLWTNRNDSLIDSSLAVAPNGDVIVTGSISNDFATVACSSAGMSLWTNYYNGLGNSNDTAVAVGVSPAGNVFVTGSSRNAGSFYDYATIAYSGAGVPLWTNRYGELGVSCMASAVVVNSNGTVFVTGYTSGGSSSKDFITIVYSEAGVPLSTNRYNGPEKANDVVPRYSLALAPDGVVVAGSSAVYTNLPGAASDYTLVKYTIIPDPNPPGTNGLPSPTITPLPGGEVQLTFYGIFGSSYVLEHSFDLSSNTWTPMQTNTAASNGAVPFTYLPLGPLNFWRIRPLP